MHQDSGGTGTRETEQVDCMSEGVSVLSLEEWVAVCWQERWDSKVKGMEPWRPGQGGGLHMAEQEESKWRSGRWLWRGRLGPEDEGLCGPHSNGQQGAAGCFEERNNLTWFVFRTSPEAAKTLGWNWKRLTAETGLWGAFRQERMKVWMWRCQTWDFQGRDGSTACLGGRKDVGRQEARWFLQVEAGVWRLS